MITLINGANNPLYAEVKKSITYCLVSQTADKATNRIAIYRTQEEQVERMTNMYDRWAKDGRVWTLASTKVGTAQFYPFTALISNNVL